MQVYDSRLIGLIAARRTAAKAGNGFESVTSEMIDDSEPPCADDVMNEVVANLQALPEDEKGDPATFKAALGILVQHSETALKRFRAGNRDPFGRDERASLEAVIKADGSRPSLLLRRGEANANHPLARSWANSIVATRDTIRKLALSVGRIEPAQPSSTNYFGTGWVVNSEAGLILTNRHVMDKMLGRPTTIFEPQGSRYRIHDGVFIDFDCETGIDTVNRFQIVEATPARAAGDQFAALDVAVLRIEPLSGDGGSRSAVPPRVIACADGDAVTKLSLPSMCVVGFPGQPPAINGVEEIANAGTIDWAWVHTVLFGGGGKYGLKRLAPGAVDRKSGHLGSEADPRKWIFGHEATTLGGNSGSPMFAWTAPNGGYAFGIHFFGDTLASNRAHSFAAAAEALSALGVPVNADDGW